MIQILLHILGYDIWFYISHRLLHTQLLWKYHEIHHRIRFPRFPDTYTGHWLEGPFQSIGFALPLAFMECTWISFFIALLLVNIRGMARHDDRTIWLIGNHHLLHHQYFNYNYGEYWIDRLCGTLIRDRHKTRPGLIYV
jgi:lathosterol oxidase